MTALRGVPYIFNRLRECGFGTALWDPEATTDTTTRWAGRMMRAHQNAVENLVIFTPLVLGLHAAGISNAVTAKACMVYFFARTAHYLAFTFGVPLLRVVTFAVGVTDEVTLALALPGGYLAALVQHVCDRADGFSPGLESVSAPMPRHACP
jgi:uncharacterized MAPEG superfamily protein